MAAELTPSAKEVLGALAPFGREGPHRRTGLRRFTRLTEPAFDAAVAELADQGIVACDSETLWVTPSGEEVASATFN